VRAKLSCSRWTPELSLAIRSGPENRTRWRARRPLASGAANRPSSLWVSEHPTLPLRFQSRQTASVGHGRDQGGSALDSCPQGFTLSCRRGVRSRRNPPLRLPRGAGRWPPGHRNACPHAPQAWTPQRAPIHAQRCAETAVTSLGPVSAGDACGGGWLADHESLESSQPLVALERNQQCRVMFGMHAVSNTRQAGAQP